MALIRAVIVGNVDDGKSTLLGRWMVDSGQLKKDQLTQVYGEQGIQYAHVSDGLKMERDQGITVDVAYRFLKRGETRFIVADCPGHEEFTANMLTGASSADIGIILIDVSRPLKTQTYRHLALLELLGIKNVLVCINKLDLCDFEEEPYQILKKRVEPFIKDLGFNKYSFLPMSALAGENILESSSKMPWYSGLPFFDQLQSFEALLKTEDSVPLYLVQGFASDGSLPGRLLSGKIQVGSSLGPQKIKQIRMGQKTLSQAVAGQSLNLVLEDAPFFKRGDILGLSSTRIATRGRARIFWLSEEAEAAQNFILQGIVKKVKANLGRTKLLMNPISLKREASNQMLQQNEIAEVDIELSDGFSFTPYAENKDLGSFLLVDHQTHRTLAAGFWIS